MRISDWSSDVCSSDLDAETGERGYVLTGRDPYLTPYQDAAAAVQAEMGRLNALTAGNPQHQARLQALRPLVKAKLEELAEVIRVRREKGSEAAVELIESGEGRRTMSDIRTLLDRMEGQGNDLLEQRSVQAKELAAFTFDAIIYGTVISFLLLGLIGFFVSRSITVPVRNAVNALSSAAAEILAGTTQQAAGMREQSSAVAETVTTVDEVLQTSAQAAQRANAVAASSTRAVGVSDAGRKAVGDSVAVMGTVREQTGSIAESILALAEQAQAIGEIIATVSDIAEQTNLLALNAAIEAARAGQPGQGLTVQTTDIKEPANQEKKA